MKLKKLYGYFIQRGSLEHLSDCERTLVNSELGRRYFTAEEHAKRAIKEGLEQGTLFVALTDDTCVGFVWYLPDGVFHSFPYIHIISVDEGYRKEV